MSSVSPSSKPIITLKPVESSPRLLPPLPLQALDKGGGVFSNPLPNKNEIELGSLVRKLKEDRIVDILNRQNLILEDLKQKISSQTENEHKKLADYIEKLERDREDYLKQQHYEELVKERVEKKIRDYLSYGMGYNPYYPSLLPYLIFNLPKIDKKKKDEDEDKKKKKKKGKKKTTEKKKQTVVIDPAQNK